MPPADAPLPLTQSPEFAKAAPALGLEAQFQCLSADGREVGRALVLSRSLPLIGQVRAILRGPIWDGNTPPEARHAALRTMGASTPHLIEADGPDPTLGAAGYRMVMTPGATCWLDIREMADPSRGRVAHPKWRASLTKAQAAALEIRSGPFRGQAADWLLIREADLRKVRGFRSVAAPMARALNARLPGALRLVTAHEPDAQDDLLAAMLFVTHGHSATYLIGATTDRGRNLCAHHLILSETCDALRRDRIGWIDLGQIDTAANPGLARFKLGTGAQLCPLGGSWLRLPFCRRRIGAGRAGSPMAERLKR